MGIINDFQSMLLQDLFYMSKLFQEIENLDIRVFDCPGLCFKHWHLVFMKLTLVLNPINKNLSSEKFSDKF